MAAEAAATVAAAVEEGWAAVQGRESLDILSGARSIILFLSIHRRPKPRGVARNPGSQEKFSGFQKCLF